MTITIKPVTAAVAIALIGVLAGLAIGQIATADSARGEASISLTPRQSGQLVREAKAQTREAKAQTRSLKRIEASSQTIGSGVAEIRGQLGTSWEFDDLLADIRNNTGLVCREAAIIGCRR